MSYYKPTNIAFLSTYPPRECGIATFTQDLMQQLNKTKSMNQSRIIAISNHAVQYDHNVMMELQQHDKSSYIKTANRLNYSDIDLLVIEHEYGIYGGAMGEYLLELVENLRTPFVTTLHTVLPEPNDKQRHILNVLGHKGKKIITMAKNSADILVKTYGIDPAKISVLSHGVPHIPMKSREDLKAESGLKNRTIISTFGLLGPGKGLEFGLAAIAKVAKKHKDVLYFVLGQTHPVVVKETGEVYRQSLEEMVAKFGIEENVAFVNKYLTKEEIIRYLKLSDIYLTPYIGKDQAVSGTLAYAAGYGRVIVSTPYSYAKEMLSQGRGLLAKFNDSESIADCVEYVLDHPDEKKQMEKRTLEIGKTMMWENIAKEYSGLFSRVLSNKEKTAAKKEKSAVSGESFALIG